MEMFKVYRIIQAGLLILLAALFVSCETPVDIEIPDQPPQIVIEGSIETGMPPVVLVSKTRGFFEPTSAQDIANSYLDNAEVFVNGIPLTRSCTDEIPPELEDVVSELIGILPEDLDDVRVCAYIGTDQELIGQENTTYNLNVLVDEKELTSTTHIPNINPPDSVWFRLWANSPQYGYVFCNVTDPDTLNNAYRVFTKRIGPNNNDNPVDELFYSPFQSAFIDEFFNGETVEVGFVRGMPPNSSRPVDNGEEAGFFEIGDRFVLKFTNITEPTYDFFLTYEAQQGTNGSPFASPSNVISNINGGLGIWAGYAVSYDTVYAAP